MLEHAERRRSAEEPVSGMTTVLVGHLARVTDESVVLMPSLDHAYWIELRHADVLAFDTLSPSGACRVVVSASATVEERWTVSRIDRRWVPACRLAGGAGPSAQSVRSSA